MGEKERTSGRVSIKQWRSTQIRKEGEDVQLVLINVTVGEVTVAPFDVACIGGTAMVVACAIAVVIHNDAAAMIVVDDS